MYLTIELVAKYHSVSSIQFIVYHYCEKYIIKPIIFQE